MAGQAQNLIAIKLNSHPQKLVTSDLWLAMPTCSLITNQICFSIIHYFGALAGQAQVCIGFQ